MTTEEKRQINIEKVGDGKVALGGVLDENQVEALGSITPTADEILANMSDYNAEIEETYGSSEEDESVVQEMPEIKKPKASGKRRKSRKNSNREQSASTHGKQTMEMDLDEELKALDKQIKEPALAEEPTQLGGDMRSQILDLLKSTGDAPTEAQINQWKAQYGTNGVHVMALGEGDVYIFTHLKRGQWKKIQEMMAKIQEGGASPDVEDQLKEKVISYCCLWPKLGVEFFYNSRAGVADSLYQVILLNSYFLSPQQAMLLTTQL